MSLEIKVFNPGEALDAAFDAPYAARGYRAPDEALVPSATALLALEGSKALARLSFGMAEMGGQGQSAWIGHYEAESPGPGLALLAEACARLKALGAAKVYGPLNGSTWHRYRLALQAEGGPASRAFLGEPENDPRYAGDFKKAGFEIAQSYESREAFIADGLPHADSLPQRVQKRYGPMIRPLDLRHYDDDLKLIYDESVESFDANVLYSKISLDEFLAIFRPLKNFYNPGLVRLCVDPQGRLLGHVAAYPDGGRVILKTLSCRKAQRGQGLAHLLAYQIHDLAREGGYASVLHALMHQDNQSKAMSKPFGKLVRRYALFGRDL